MGWNISKQLWGRILRLIEFLKSHVDFLTAGEIVILKSYHHVLGISLPSFLS